MLDLVSQEYFGSDYVTENEAQVFAVMIGGLTKKIKETSRLSPQGMASVIDEEAGKIKIPHPEAYKFSSARRQFVFKGEDTGSIPFFTKALNLNPEFTMTCGSLAIAYENGRQNDLRDQYIELPGKLRTHTTEAHQYIIMGDYNRRIMNDYQKANESCIQVIQIVPAHLIARNNLEEIYRREEN